MRGAAIGAAISTSLLLAVYGMFAGPANRAIAQQPIAQQPFAQQRGSGTPQNGSELIAFSTQVGDKLQQLTVLDPRQQTLMIYHVESSTGTVTLKSVRNIHFDTQLMEFNGTSPRPQDIRSMLGTR